MGNCPYVMCIFVRPRYDRREKGDAAAIGVLARLLITDRS